VAGVSYTGATQLVQLVSMFAQRQPRWAECIVYRTKPDERWDMTLVSRRVYGRPDEFLTIMAAAGLDSVEQELTERTLVLPTARQLQVMKDRAGFVNEPSSRTRAQVADPVRTR
jgi:hypothetical protein